MARSERTATSTATRLEPLPSRGETLRYSELLARQHGLDSFKNKGERTRARLKLACVQELDESGFRDMRISDVAKRAGVSAATFYLYFENKHEITIEVLSEFLDSLVELSGQYEEGLTPFAAIYRTNLHWLAAARANAGLLRCLLQVGDEVPHFREFSRRRNHEWYQRVARRLARRFPGAGRKPDVALLAVYSLGGMMDEVCRNLIISPDGNLVDLSQRVTPSDEAIAEFLSVIWYRTLIGTDPLDLDYQSSRDVLTLTQRSKPGKTPPS